VIYDDVNVLHSSSSHRDEMFIEYKFKKILLAPEERNIADLAFIGANIALRRSASRRIIPVSINIQLLRSPRVV